MSGRIGYATNDLSVLDGLIDPAPKEVLPLARCANGKCGKPYRPRADGDDFCSERCDPLNKLGRLAADGN